jgi:peptidoglycan/xylan/chitin deacetylase (PgdA/CDA1 family)
MKFKNWFSMRGPVYTSQRAISLLARYRFSSVMAVDRIDACLKGLVDQGCGPTFSTPGILVKRYPEFIRSLQDSGAEIAVHGFQHVDLSTYSVVDAGNQLAKAVEAFTRNGISVHGFRCPYLGYTDELLDSLPAGLFEYSSNQAVYWNALNGNHPGSDNVIVKTLRNLYRAESSTITTNVPWKRLNMIEIPVSMPDDMELVDGLDYAPAEVALAWCQVLTQIHQRGELFNLIFHPELAEFCEQPFFEVLTLAKSLQPFVWVARLCDISEWWAEREGFTVDVSPFLDVLRLSFECSPRATILVKGFDLCDAGSVWEGNYQRLLANYLEIPASPRPFIGLSTKTSPDTISFLREQGYILDLSDLAANCSIYLDETRLAGLTNEVQLINYIESFPGPLVRYWRWPNGAKSALCITGDLDAISLMDYLSRLYKL